jgi:AcrR family transcriptional regulator
MKQKRTKPGSITRRQAAARKPAKPRPKTLQSSATVDRIIECARQILLQHGHAAFTTRRVAEAAGMTHGNLNYHFSSKRDLLRALIAHLLKSYSQRFEAFLSDPNYPLGQDIERMVRWLLSDAISPETVRTFRELWVLSLHDPVICRAVDDFYDEAMAGVTRILRDARPGADTAAIGLLVHLFAVVSEGGSVLYGTRPERIIPHERILELVPVLIGLIAPELQRPIDENGVAPTDKPSIAENA